jgi:hypothetical protein
MFQEHTTWYIGQEEARNSLGRIRGNVLLKNGVVGESKRYGKEIEGGTPVLIQ